VTSDQFVPFVEYQTSLQVALAVAPAISHILLLYTILVCANLGGNDALELASAQSVPGKTAFDTHGDEGKLLLFAQDVKKTRSNIKKQGIKNICGLSRDIFLKFF